MDWGQLWKITSSPDNVPIVALLFLMPFYTWYGLRQAFANDLSDPQLLAVDASDNESKGDRSPDQWMPPSQAS